MRLYLLANLYFLLLLPSKVIAQTALITGEPITTITQSMDGATLVTGHKDGIVRLWDARSNRPIRELNNASPFESITLGRCRRVFYVQPDIVGVLGLTEVRLFNPRTGQRVSSYESEQHLGVAISSSGQHALLNVRGQTQVINLKTGRTLATLAIPYQESMNLSADGRYIFYQRGSGIEQMEMSTGQKIQLYERSDDDQVKQILLSANGKKLISMDSYSVYIWDLQSAKRKRFEGESLKQVSFSATDEQLICVAGETGVFTYNIESGTVSQPVKSKQVSAVEFDQSGKVLWVAQVSRLSRVNIKTGTSDAVFSRVADIHSAACLSPDNRYLLVGTEDGFIKYFDLSTATYRGVYRKVGKAIRSLKFEANGQELEIGDGENVDVTQASNGRLLRQYQATQFAVDNLDFSDPSQKMRINTAGGHLTLAYKKYTLDIVTAQGDNRDYFAVEKRTNFFDGTQEGIEQLGLFSSPNEQIKASQLKERLYRPGLLTAFLAGGSALNSTTDLNLARLHPTVTLSAEPTAVRIKLDDQGGGFGRVALYLNRKLVLDDARPANMNSKQPSVSVRVDLSRFANFDAAGENLVEVQAYNQENYLASLKQAITIRSEQRGAPVPVNLIVQKSQKYKKPHFWALLVGVSEYADPKLNLRFAANDADHMHQALNAGSKVLFGDQVHLYKLTTSSPQAEQRPTGENIRRLLNEIKEKASRDDVILLYLAGHGQGSVDGPFYFLSTQARSLTDRYNPDEAVSDADLLSLLQGSKCQKQVLILDACYSGKLIEQFKARGELPSTTRALDRMRDRSAAYILASSTASQLTWESTEFAQGLMTHFLLEGMRGPALDDGGVVTVLKWLDYAKSRVERYTQDREALALGNTAMKAQTPQLFSDRNVEPVSVAQFPDVASRASVPLNEPRAIICRSSFLTDELNDPLELRVKLNQALESASPDQSPFNFFDYDDYPGGYRLVGKYNYNASASSLTIKQIKIFQGKSEQGVINLGDALISPSEFVEKVVRQLAAFCQSRTKTQKK